MAAACVKDTKADFEKCKCAEYGSACGPCPFCITESMKDVSRLVPDFKKMKEVEFKGKFNAALIEELKTLFSKSNYPQSSISYECNSHGQIYVIILVEGKAVAIEEISIYYKKNYNIPNSPLEWVKFGISDNNVYTINSLVKSLEDFCNKRIKNFENYTKRMEKEANEKMALFLENKTEREKASIQDAIKFHPPLKHYVFCTHDRYTNIETEGAMNMYGEAVVKWLQSEKKLNGISFDLLKWGDKRVERIIPGFCRVDNVQILVRFNNTHYETRIGVYHPGDAYFQLCIGFQIDDNKNLVYLVRNTKLCSPLQFAGYRWTNDMNPIVQILCAMHAHAKSAEGDVIKKEKELQPELQKETSVAITLEKD